MLKDAKESMDKASGLLCLAVDGLMFAAAIKSGLAEYLYNKIDASLSQAPQAQITSDFSSPPANYFGDANLPQTSETEMQGMPPKCRY